jgi:hypothetical protein
MNLPKLATDCYILFGTRVLRMVRLRLLVSRARAVSGAIGFERSFNRFTA